MTTAKPSPPSVEGEQELVGEVLHITYYDEFSAFTVAKLRPESGSSQVPIVGSLPLIQIGQKVRCIGSWVVNPRHGRQFSVTKFSYELPTNPAAIKRLISSGFLEGVGEEFAERIVRRFGSGTFRMLEEQPERLLEVPGMGKKRAAKIIDCWKKRTHEQEFFLLLTSWGISHAVGLRILRRWGSEAISVLKKNPFQLAKEIQGVGFQIADKIADKLGIPQNSTVRVDAALEFFLWELSAEGHTAIPQNLFVDRASEKLSVSKELLTERITAGVKEGQLALFQHTEGQPPHVCLKTLFAYEQQIVKNVQRLMSSAPRLRPVNTEKAIAWAEEVLHMTFATGQKDALACALENKCCIITGGPGTGKSTITKAIVSIYGKLSPKIMLAAPTGKAAKRLQEVTGRYSQTIHRLLKFNPGTGEFTHDRHNPLCVDLLILDETSMVDTYITHALLEAIPNHAKIVIIGDVDQLPSIGPGSILKDLIGHSTIPTVRLTEIYRQAKFSTIVQNAHRINKGEMPFLTAEKGDFLFIKALEPEEIRRQVVDLVSKRLPSSHHFDPRKEIQILVPMRKGSCGIEQLNVDLQALFSPSDGVGYFRTGDKVIQSKNNYQKEVFNGDVGFVKSIDEHNAIQVIFDDRVVTYTGDERDELALAWAVSVHKFQGSECPCVIIPLHTQHFKLLNRHLLYTAVTRGKRLVVVVGSPKAIAIAVHQVGEHNRWTNLGGLLVSKLCTST